jgi:hypothetical protein
MTIRTVCCAAAAAALSLAPAAANASHGKVGLWHITTTMSGMAAAIPPAVRAQMKERGIDMPDTRTITAQHCMTPEEVATDTPPPMEGECHVLNVNHTGGSFSADLKCSGHMNGSGHFQVTYDSPEHYAGQATLQAIINGRPMTMTNRFDGRWVKADCGSVTH